VKRALPTALLAALALAPSAHAATACSPIRDPYPGTRYEGADLTHIRATHVSCTTARNVVRGAHRTALGITPNVTGIRRFTWHGWHVTGDLRPAHDKYVAARGSKRIRWEF
jgi:hypothetical protein